MIWLVLLICVANIGCGFMLALWLEDLDWSGSPGRASSSPAAAEAVISTNLAPRRAQPETASVTQQWLDILQGEAVVAESFVEAALPVLRLDLSQYRSRLVEIDESVRDCQADPDTARIKGLLRELKTVNEEWMTQQSHAAEHLTEKVGRLGAFEELGDRLAGILRDQAVQIEQTASDAMLRDFTTDVRAGCSRLLGEIRGLIDLSHELRDASQDSLLEIVKAEGRLGQIEDELQQDALTGLLNRTGLEVLFANFWDDDPRRTRQLSCAFLDVDRFTPLLETHGAAACDRLLAGLGSLLRERTRQDRGFDRVARFSGERFALFLGDTSTRDATGVVESLRQTIEAATFEIGDATIELTVSCGATDVRRNDTTADVFERLEAALRAAKEAGRNRTYLDGSDGPQALEPPDLGVTGRVVECAVPLKEQHRSS